MMLVVTGQLLFVLSAWRFVLWKGNVIEIFSLREARLADENSKYKALSTKHEQLTTDPLTTDHCPLPTVHCPLFFIDPTVRQPYCSPYWS